MKFLFLRTKQHLYKPGWAYSRCCLCELLRFQEVYVPAFLAGRKTCVLWMLRSLVAP